VNNEIDAKMQKFWDWLEEAVFNKAEEMEMHDSELAPAITALLAKHIVAGASSPEDMKEEVIQATASLFRHVEFYSKGDCPDCGHQHDSVNDEDYVPGKDEIIN